jgi:hypothetical protein
MAFEYANIGMNLLEVGLLFGYPQCLTSNVVQDYLMMSVYSKAPRAIQINIKNNHQHNERMSSHLSFIPHTFLLTLLPFWLTLLPSLK